MPVPAPDASHQTQSEGQADAVPPSWP